MHTDNSHMELKLNCFVAGIAPLTARMGPLLSRYTLLKAAPFSTLTRYDFTRKPRVAQVLSDEVVSTILHCFAGL